MQRSLTSGVSGMLNNQLVLDVTANNLANVNTTGFKSSTVSFSNALIQTEFAGSAPGSAIGGENPKQVGLGMQTSTISLDMRQGSLQATGRNLDLAIQGQGFFEVTDGTKPSYTRVGNFGFDSSDNLVDLGTGYKVVGNVYNKQANPDGTQNILQINAPLQIQRSEAFPPKRTETVTMQGNLSSATPALRGATLQSLFALVDKNGKAASETTLLKDLSIYNTATATPGAKTLYVYGTKPDGEAFGGSFSFDPSATPSAGNAQAGTVGNLVGQLNNVLAQGNERFGSVRLDNGNLVATGVGTGVGFSLYMGELNPMTSTINNASLTSAGGVSYAGVAIAGSAGANSSATIAAGSTGLLTPTFTMPPNDYSAQVGASLRVSVKINGVERGTITMPAADYTTVPNTFTLASMPHVGANDVVSYDLAGNLDLTAGAPPTTNLTWSTRLVADNDPANLTADVDGDGLPDMYQDGSATDTDKWVLSNDTNATINWYQSRFVPDSVSSSIEVYDSQGGKHSIEARYLRVGTRTDPASGAKIGSWDLVVGTTPGDANVVANVVAGIEFDQQGRFTGSIGTTIHGTTMNDTDFVGNPASDNIRLDWVTTGPTDPAVMRMDFGAPGAFKGLTSFGSTSTAAAISQDGYADGKLDTLSVSSEGDLVGLYTNGISRKLAQITLSVFRNPEGLNQDGNNLFTQSVNSGTATQRVAGSGAGFLTAGALEGGNVDIATEFTRIITAQRGFQVSARVITTTDQMLQELANLIH